MHLLDMPKSKRAPRLPYLTLFAAVYLAAVPCWSHRPEPMGEIISCRPRRALFTYSPELLKSITVTRTWSHHMWSFKLHEQMPLMELYDELCEIEDKAEREAQTIEGRASNAFLEQIYLRAEKKFMRKYGLTLEQVKMIKRDGYRIIQDRED